MFDLYFSRTNTVYAESDEEPETSSVKRKFAKPPAIHFPGTVVTLSVMILQLLLPCIIQLIC